MEPYKCPNCNTVLRVERMRFHYKKEIKSRFVLCRICGAIGNAFGKAALSKKDIIDLRKHPAKEAIKAEQELVVKQYWG